MEHPPGRHEGHSDQCHKYPHYDDALDELLVHDSLLSGVEDPLVLSSEGDVLDALGDEIVAEVGVVAVAFVDGPGGRGGPVLGQGTKHSLHRAALDPRDGRVVSVSAAVVAAAEPGPELVLLLATLLGDLLNHVGHLPCGKIDTYYEGFGLVSNNHAVLSCRLSLVKAYSTLNTNSTLSHSVLSLVFLLGLWFALCRLLFLLDLVAHLLLPSSCGLLLVAEIVELFFGLLSLLLVPVLGLFSGHFPGQLPLVSVPHGILGLAGVVLLLTLLGHVHGKHGCGVGGRRG